MRIAAAIALVAALLGSATASAVGGVTAESATPTGFETQAVEITGGNEALSGWQYYFYNETIKHIISRTNCLFAPQRTAEQATRCTFKEILRKMNL